MNSLPVPEEVVLRLLAEQEGWLSVQKSEAGRWVYKPGADLFELGGSVKQLAEFDDFLTSMDRLNEVIVSLNEIELRRLDKLLQERRARLLTHGPLEVLDLVYIHPTNLAQLVAQVLVVSQQERAVQKREALKRMAEETQLGQSGQLGGGAA